MNIRYITEVLDALPIFLDGGEKRGDEVGLSVLSLTRETQKDATLH